MNKQDRLRAAIAGEPTDRVPVALWRHWPGDDQRADDLAAAHISFQRTFDWDFVKVSPSSSFCLEHWGVRDRWEGDPEGTRRYERRPIQQPDDWTRIAVASPHQAGLSRQLECLSALRAAFGTDTPYVQTIFSPLAQAKNLAGQETLAVHLRQFPYAVHAALRAITSTTITFVEEAKRRGIAGLYYAVQLATYRDLSEAEYRVFGRPYDLEVLRSASDLWLNILHIHGTDIMFDVVSDYPAHVVNWHDRETAPLLADGLKRIHGAASGGVSRDVLLLEDPELALNQARDADRQTQGRRWILGTGCVTMVTTPSGNLYKLRRYVEQAGS